MKRDDNRPSFVGFITGVCLSVLTALGVVFSACSNKLPNDRRQSGTGGEQAAGGSGANAANTDSGAGNTSANGGSAASGTVGAGGVTSRPYAPSCAQEVCTSDEKCADGPAGTYCVHPCTGQPCPPGDAQVAYCTRKGGVICLAQ